MVAPIETSILNRLMRGQENDLPPELARLVLSWRFDEADQARVADLSAKARAGILSAEESHQLDWYLLLGDFLAIFQSKARLALRNSELTQPTA